MIGYNVEKIQNLMESIKKSYDDIETAMSTPWPNLSALMRREWIGPDEYANEKTLANTLDELYQACAEAIEGVAGNIFSLGEAWRQFQGVNTIKGGVGATLKSIGSLTEIKLKSGSLNIWKEGDKFADNQDLGLVNGLTSANNITQAIDTYADTVYNAVDKLYQNLDDSVKGSFLGDEQSPKIVEYLHNMGSAIAKLTVCIKKVKEAIGEAAKAYQSQASLTAEQASSAQSELDVSDSLAGTSGQ